MRIFSNIFASLAVASVVLAAPVEVEARKFPKGIKKPKKTSEFRKIKSDLRAFGANGARAYNNFKAAYRSERRNRQVYNSLRNAESNAETAFNADRSPGNQAAWNNAIAARQGFEGQYQNALATYRGAKAEVGRLRETRNTAINFQRQQQGIQPRPARQARPQFAQNRRVQQHRIGASVAPNVNAALNGGARTVYAGSNSVPPARQNAYQPVRDSQMFAARDGGYFVPGPPPQMYGQEIVANPSAFPTAALQQSAPANAQQSQTYEQPDSSFGL
jgi:hypothetical protein